MHLAAVNLQVAVAVLLADGDSAFFLVLIVLDVWLIPALLRGEQMSCK
jgi:hypothetical protein